MIGESPVGSKTMNQFNKNKSIYDALTLLAQEIKDGIRNLSSQSANQIDADYERMKAASLHNTYPEVSLVTSLYRKYADTAHTIKDDLLDQIDRMGVLADLPSLYEVKEEKQLAGWTAMKSNVFWIRVISSLCSLICIILLASIDYLSYSDFNPSWEFLPSCEAFQGHYFTGSFPLWPYQLCLGVGVICYSYSAVIAVYYLLPLDDENKKTLPGISSYLISYNHIMIQFKY
jgi:hypothetical protein